MYKRTNIIYSSIYQMKKKIKIKITQVNSIVNKLSVLILSAESGNRVTK